jgi:hypothetical protein
MCLPIPFVLLPRFFLTLLFHSHVVSNHAARDSAENGVMVHEMSSHRADGSAFEAAFRVGRRNAAQSKARSRRRDHDMSHAERSQLSFEHLGRREREFNRA